MFPDTGDKTLSFFNRDHVVMVQVYHEQIVILTTLGVQISMPATKAILTKFVDDLASDVDSNFVSITSTLNYQDQKSPRQAKARN